MGLKLLKYGDNKKGKFDTFYCSMVVIFNTVQREDDIFPYTHDRMTAGVFMRKKQTFVKVAYVFSFV